MRKSIRVDHGPEFASKALDRWACEQKVTLDFSRSGKPTANPYGESFNGRCSKVSASFLFSDLPKWLLHGGPEITWWTQGSTSSNTDKSSDTLGRKRVAERVSTNRNVRLLYEVQTGRCDPRRHC